MIFIIGIVFQQGGEHLLVVGAIWMARQNDEHLMGVVGVKLLEEVGYGE